jgi:uncharacterized RDD family membrane protein YckC
MNLVVMLALLLVMFTTFRQRPALPPEVLRRARLAPAPIGLRLLAGGIDLLPLIGAVAYVAWRISRAAAAGADSVTFSTAEELTTFGLALVYLLHTTLAECLAGRTLGKALCGLRVVSLDGRPASLGSLLLRNAIRPLDVLLLFPLVIALTNPLRQRVGDLAAGTVVVLNVEETDDRRRDDEET